MATWVGVGSSRQPDSFQAGSEAARRALESMGQSRPDLVLVFASVRFDQEILLKGIVSVTDDAPMAGCSTAGEILTSGPSRRSVVVMTIKSGTLKVTTGLGVRISENPRRAGQEVAAAAIQSKLTSPNTLLIFPDGVKGNTAEVIRGAQDVLGLSFPIVGGSAADDFGFIRTYQYFNGQVYNDSVAGVLLAGTITVGVGARHGWQPLGKPKRVTQASGNIVKQLDGESAVNLYEEYFGNRTTALKVEELARISIMYPLGFPVPGEEEYLLRNAIGLNLDGTLIFSGEVPEGVEVRLMMGSKSKALEAARRAAEQAALAMAPRLPSFAFVFSCISRGQLFGRNMSAEIDIIRKALGETVPLIGFYDYGEQAPLAATDFHGRSYLHNESLVVAAVSAT